jgi:hypothetical protein
MGHPTHIPRTHKSGLDVLRGVPEENSTLGIASSGLSGLAHKVRRNLEDYGWRIALKKTVAYLVRSVYLQQVYRIYRINLDAIKPSEDSNKHNFTFKILTTQNVDMIAQVEHGFLETDKVRGVH